MIPTLSLGPLDSPSIEILRKDLYPILACLIEDNEPLSKDDENMLWSCVGLDGAHLAEDSQHFFRMLEKACQSIVYGQRTEFDFIKLRKMDLFRQYLGAGIKDGTVHAGAKNAAQRFLNFLSEHSVYWPPRNL